MHFIHLFKPTSAPRRLHVESPLKGSFSGESVVFTADMITLEQANQHRETILASIPDINTFDRLINIYYEQAVSTSYINLFLADRS
jgi:hypothetical protein